MVIRGYITPVTVLPVLRVIVLYVFSQLLPAPVLNCSKEGWLNGEQYLQTNKNKIMGKQSGVLPIEGTLGNITFYKTKDGYMVKEKSTVSASKIANDPAYARTRENMAEFGRAGKSAKVLRTVLGAVIHGSTDGRMVSRLTKLMLEVIKMDQTSTRGQRNVIDGEAQLLEGFEFNSNGKLSTTLLAPFTGSINRVSGEAAVNIPAFVPAKMLAVPGGATHYKIRSGAAWIDFENETGALVEAQSGYLPIDNLFTTVLNLTMQLPAASTHPLFLVLNLEFVQDINGIRYLLQNGAFNACTIVKVDGN